MNFHPGQIPSSNSFNCLTLIKTQTQKLPNMAATTQENAVAASTDAAQSAVTWGMQFTNHIFHDSLQSAHIHAVFAKVCPVCAIA